MFFCLDSFHIIYMLSLGVPQAGKMLRVKSLSFVLGLSAVVLVRVIHWRG